MDTTWYTLYGTEDWSCPISGRCMNVTLERLAMQMFAWSHNLIVVYLRVCWLKTIRFKRRMIDWCATIAVRGPSSKRHCTWRVVLGQYTTSMEFSTFHRPCFQGRHSERFWNVWKALCCIEPCTYGCKVCNFLINSDLFCQISFCLWGCTHFLILFCSWLVRILWPWLCTCRYVHAAGDTSHAPPHTRHGCVGRPNWLGKCQGDVWMVSAHQYLAHQMGKVQRARHVC